MSIVISDPALPISSGEFRIGDSERFAEIERKHRFVSQYLESNEFDALLLQRPANFAWFTTGSEISRGETAETMGALFITPEARVVITGNADSAHLFEQELAGLGFQLKERPWHEPRQTLIEDISRGRHVACDTGGAETSDISTALRDFRIPLTQFESGRLRELGRIVAHAVEATARSCAQGSTEAEIAGEVAHRLVKNQILPERIQVWGDGRVKRYPHRRFRGENVERFGTISVIGRRDGLHVGAARTFCFGEPPEDVRDTYFRAVLAQSTGMYFSQAGWEISKVWQRVRRIYEKYGSGEEWQNADQAEVIGYQSCEVPVVPRSQFPLQAGMPIFWHPLVESTMVGDSILLVDGGFELLTPMERWPKLYIDIKGTRLERPDILRRMT